MDELLRAFTNGATKCLCELCSPLPAKTYTEAWRHECEVRYVVALGTNAERKSYLALVNERRGTEAAARLRKDAWAQINGQLELL